MRPVALGEQALAIIEAQRRLLFDRAAECSTSLIADAFVYSDSPDGSESWKPDGVTQHFGRLRDRAGIRPEVKFKHLRKFMETYGQEAGFSLAQVAIRAGHDPAVAATHYTGRVSETDRALARAIEALLTG